MGVNGLRAGTSYGVWWLHQLRGLSVRAEGKFFWRSESQVNARSLSSEGCLCGFMQNVFCKPDVANSMMQPYAFNDELRICSAGQCLRISLNEVLNFFSTELIRLAEARLLSDAAAAESCISYASSNGTRRNTTAPASGGTLYPSSESLYGIDCTFNHLYWRTEFSRFQPVHSPCPKISISVKERLM